MKKIIIVLLAVSSSVLFAGGGGGGAIFGGYGTGDKYVTSKTSKVMYIEGTANRNCSKNIKITTISSIQAQVWLWSFYSWHDGYATTRITQCGKAINVNKIQIYQRVARFQDITKTWVYYNKPKQAVSNNSYMKYSLANEGSTIHTVHSVLVSGVGDKHINNHNTWNNSWIDGKSIPSQDVYKW